MSTSTVVNRDTARAVVPAPRSTTRRYHAACAAISAALGEAGCIVVTTTVTGSDCTIEFYDARSLALALDVLATAARAIGEDDLAARAAQSGDGAWRVTAGPQTWHGAEGDPHTAVTRSSTSWRLRVPADDLVAAATALLV